MSVKVLGLLGSPRRKGNNELLLDQALSGAQSEGAKVEKMVLNDLDITPCQACGQCLSTGECVIRDDMERIYPELKLAQHLILASPVFFLGLPAQAKLLIDRCQCLWAGRNALPHPERSTQRRGLLILTASGSDLRQFQPLLSTVRAFFATLGITYRGELLFGGLEERGEVLHHPGALERAFEAGAKLVKGEEIGPLLHQTPFYPIGWVRNSYREAPPEGWERTESELVIEPEVEPALDGLEDFSHLIVLFWMHSAKYEGQVKIHPQGRKEMPLVGLLASRSPHRPNPIGMTVVRLLERQGRVLRVRGLDAFDGTPIIDLKPYLSSDEIPDAKRPEWVRGLEKGGIG